MRSLRELAQRGVVTVVLSKWRPYVGWKEDHFTSVASTTWWSQSSVTSVLGDTVPTSEISVHYTHVVHIHRYRQNLHTHTKESIYFSMCIESRSPLKSVWSCFNTSELSLRSSVEICIVLATKPVDIYPYAHSRVCLWNSSKFMHNHVVYIQNMGIYSNI